MWNEIYHDISTFSRICTTNTRCPTDKLLRRLLWYPLGYLYAQKLMAQRDWPLRPVPVVHLTGNIVAAIKKTYYTLSRLFDSDCICSTPIKTYLSYKKVSISSSQSKISRRKIQNPYIPFLKFNNCIILFANVLIILSYHLIFNFTNANFPHFPICHNFRLSELPFYHYKFHFSE